MSNQERASQTRDRGAAMAEYAVLIGGVAIMLIISLQAIGGTVDGIFVLDGTEEVEEEVVEVAAPANEAATGVCPNGWDLIPNNLAKKNGQNVDANGDGLICRKQIPGKGKGNTNLNQNVKDNNG